MLYNPSMFIFTLCMITGTLISISSSSWMGMWMGLEMNLLSFIPLINKNSSPYETESAMKYFLVQAMASILFLIAIISNEMVNFYEYLHPNYIINTALMMKMGAAPFHFWFPGVMEGTSWLNCFILMTWQKIAPFILISYKMMSTMVTMIIILTTLIGSVGGLNQNSLRKIMAYSSISHIGWMLSAMMISNTMWLIYFSLYMILNMAMIYLFMVQKLYNLNQLYKIKNEPLIKFSMMITMLSLGGLPPFLGFLPKWMVIQELSMQKSMLMLLFMVMMTLLTLYFYMRIMFSSFMFLNQEMKWNLNKKSSNLVSMTMAVSILGIPIMIWLMY